MDHGFKIPRIGDQLGTTARVLREASPGSLPAKSGGRSARIGPGRPGADSPPRSAHRHAGRPRLGRRAAAGAQPAARSRAITAHRSFDPRVVGPLEATAWVAYYRHDWLAFARAAIAASRGVFGLSWPATIRCAWLVLRANQRWAPFPDNDPDAARRAMERFYRIIQRRTAEPFDPARAAALEVQWWAVHRSNQRSQRGGDDAVLTDAIAKLYAHVYGVPEPSVRRAAQQRALAMRHSDRWVSDGCPTASALIDAERDALISSYHSLLAAVQGHHGDGAHRPPPGAAPRAASARCRVGAH